MSVKASTWAWEMPLKSGEKLVLLALADKVNDLKPTDFRISELEKLTSLNFKAIQKTLLYLSENKFIRYRTSSDDCFTVILAVQGNIPWFTPSKIKRLNGSAWAKLKKKVLIRDNYTCQYCGKLEEKMHCDHIIPLAKNGNDDLNNLVTACFKCNNSKGKKLLEEWKR